MEAESTELRPSDLPLVLYLNQRVTFDILAALEDGFATLASVETLNSSSKSRDTDKELSIGLSNPFAFLQMGLRGRSSDKGESNSATKSTEQLVYTPASLFARLRADLTRRGLVRMVEGDAAAVSDIRPGEFVEFRATLRRPSLVSFLRNFKELAPFMDSTEGTGASKGPGGGKPRASGTRGRQNPNTLSRLDTMLRAVTSDGAEDLVARTPKATMVLTAESEYFVDRSMNDVIDGDFIVFGKITRSLGEDSKDSINLLRRSPIGRFAPLANALKNLDQSPALQELGFDIDEVESEVHPPALQLVPIAIFV